jgi:pheromone shutdown protein TraB
MEDTRDKQKKQEESGRSEPEAEKKDKKPTRDTGKGPSMGKIVGGGAAFLALALYFVWIGNEMGSHAVSGSFEMWAIFGAIFIGVVAMIAGGASMRRR